MWRELCSQGLPGILQLVPDALTDRAAISSAHCRPFTVSDSCSFTCTHRHAYVVTHAAADARPNMDARQCRLHTV